MNSSDSFRLDGRVALVTGVGRGLGHGVALALAAAGADIVGVYRHEYADAAAAVEALGRRFLPLHCDLSAAPPEQIAGLAERAEAELGRLDILVNNAGMISRVPALEVKPETWEQVLRVNLTVPFLLAQAAARLMAPRGSGRIINIVSMLSFQGGILVPAYAASKSGLLGLTRALANEWAALGIGVNAIAPGYMATDNTAALQADPERSAAIISRIPAGRWGRPDDLGGAVVFLASEASAYLSGAVIPVDGGWLAR